MPTDSEAALESRKILITSGPTRGLIDAVRYITNRSSGRLGVKIAQEALRRGAAVDFVYGVESLVPQVAPDSDQPATKLALFPIETVDQLSERLRHRLTCQRVDAVIHLMAVLDFEPAETLSYKLPSNSNEEWTIRLKRTPKIIAQIKTWNPETLLVGFKLEVHKTREELQRIGHEALIRTRADLTVVNDLDSIRDEQHEALVVGPTGQVLATCSTKTEIAQRVLDLIESALQSPDQDRGQSLMDAGT